MRKEKIAKIELKVNPFSLDEDVEKFKSIFCSECIYALNVLYGNRCKLESYVEIKKGWFLVCESYKRKKEKK